MTIIIADRLPVRRKRPSLHEQVKAHVEYSLKAQGCCERAVAYREAGKGRQAKAAEAHARKWLGKARQLEPPRKGRS